MKNRNPILQYQDCNADEFGRRKLDPDYTVFDELVRTNDIHGEIKFRPEFDFVESVQLNHQKKVIDK